MNYLIIFLITLFLSIFFTFFIKKIAIFFDVVDRPNKERKIHKKNIPLLGGIAIFISFFLMLFFLRDKLISGDLNYSHWIGVFLASFVLIVGGSIDDKFDLSAGKQIFFPILAVVLVLAFGVDVEKITNPFGDGFFYLDQWTVSIASVHFSVISAFLVSFWLMGMMYTTKLLDGLDGLVTGIAMIGSFIIFLFTITEKYYQGDIALASLVLAGACFGFLIFNWHPASIFLGEGGSLFLGFILGVLAIISGGKIAIALLVMGIPIMDLMWTIVRRLGQKKNPFKFADRKHLHFRLLDAGISQRRTVLLYYLIAFSFGLSALFLQSKGKLTALMLLVILMFFFIFFFREKNKEDNL